MQKRFYKLVRYESIFSKLQSLCTFHVLSYIPGFIVEAEPAFKTKGYHPTVFRDKKSVLKFMHTHEHCPYDTKLLLVEALESPIPRKACPPMLNRRGQDQLFCHEEINPESDWGGPSVGVINGKWPAGTVMLPKLKVLKVIPWGEVLGDGEFDD